MASPVREGEHLVREKVGKWSKFDRISTVALVLGGAGALAIAASQLVWDRVLLYVLVGLVAAAVAAFVAWLMRRVVLGKLTPDAEDQMHGQVRWLGLRWIVIKVGILFASLYLFIAAGVAAVMGWRVGFLIEAAVLLALTMMMGNLVVSCVSNIALIRSRAGMPDRVDPNI